MFYSCMAPSSWKFALLVTFNLLSACSDGMDGVDGQPDAGPDAIAKIATTQTQSDGFGLSPLAGVPDPGSQWAVSGTAIAFIGAWSVPLALPIGSTVPSLFTSIKDNSSTCWLCSDGVVINMMLVSYVGSSAVVLGTATSTGSGEWQTVSLNLSHIVTATEILQVRYVTVSSPMPPSRMSTIGMLQVGVGATVHRRSIPLFSSSGSQYTEQPLTQMVFPSYNIAEFPIAVEPGEIIADVAARVRCGTIGAVTMRLIRRDVSGSTPSATQVGSTSTCTGTATEETLHTAGVSELVGSDYTHYLLDFTMNNAGPVYLDIAYVTTR